MIAINAYLNFAGKTEKAMQFYKSVFGGDFDVIQKFKDMPGGDRITEQKGIYTSGGSTSYWNLLLHLVEKYADKSTAIWASK